MRLNFRKISAVLTGVVMLGSTMGIAAAASYPAPFVSGGTANVAIVYGTGSGVSALDAIAAGNLQSDLQGKMGSGGGAVSTTCAGGDCYLIQMPSTKVNVNDTLTSIKATALNYQDLPNLLKDGVYKSYDSQSYGYSQTVTLDAGLVYTSIQDRDYNDNKPSLGIYVARNKPVFNYTLSWTKQPKSTVSAAGRLSDIENTKITILGKEYTILNAYAASQNTDQTKWELMGGAVVDSVSRDETKTATLDGKTYTIRATYISDTKAKLCVSIDGAAEEKCDVELTKGTTTELSNGIQLGIRAINYAAKSGTIDSVDFSLGAEKLTLQDTQVVQMNSNDITGLTAYISNTTSSSKEQEGNLILRWVANDKVFVAGNSTAVLPGLGGLKLASGGYYTPPGKTDVIKTTNSGSQRIELRLPIKDGDATIPLLYGNGSAFTVIGSDTNRYLATTNNSILSYNYSTGANADLFVASWNSTKDYQSYLLTASVYQNTGVNYTKITNKVTNTVACDVKSGDVCTIGSVVLTTASASYVDNSVDLTIGDGGSFETVFSKNGLVFYLPATNTTGASLTKGAITLAGAQTSWTLKAKEADRNDNLGGGKWINQTVAWSSPGTGGKAYVSAVNSHWSDGTTGNPAYRTTSTSDDYASWVYSDLGTYVVYHEASGAQFDTDTTYYGGETYGLTYAAQKDADISQVSTSKSSTSTTQQLGEVIYKDSEIKSAKDKNLIVVGGSCINSVAADLLGSTEPLCGDVFTTKTGAGAGQFVIESFGDKYATGKIALLVAGYNVDDTQNAATYLKTKMPDTTAGKTWIGTSATEATLKAAAV